MSRRPTLATRLTAAVTLLALLLPPPDAHGQATEYDVANFGLVPGSYLTYANDLNSAGVVVGSALYIPGGIKAWTWSADDGYTILPEPPTTSGYAAVDINDAGVIAGDGGGDGGEIWRYTAGTYEMLGVLAGMPIPHAEGINAAGTITGTCFGTLFYNPRHSFLAETGSPMFSLLANSESFGINDAGQVTGKQSLTAYRFTPGQGVEFLPPLGPKFITAGYAINNQGHVVGVAGSTAEHDDVPFLFTDAGGMQEIGNFGGRAYAAAINDLDQVVGNWEPSSGSRRPWFWSAQDGVRFLNDLVDPALGLSVRRALGINNAGQILCDARQQSDNDIVPLLLSPTSEVCQTDLGFGGPGTATLAVCGQALASGQTATLRLDSDAPLAPAFLGWGPTLAPTSFGGGTLGPSPLSGLLLATDAQGDVVAAGIPGGAGPLVLYVQGLVADPLQVGGMQLTNVVELEFLP